MIKQSAAAALLLASSGAIAADSVISFNNLSARYIDSEIDGTGGDGYGINLNVALLDYVFATVDYSSRSYDFGPGDVDLEFVRVGLGGNWGFLENEALQVYGTLTWEQLDLGSSGSTGGGNGGGDGGDGGGDGGGDCDFTGTPLDGLFGALGPVLGFCDPGGEAASAKAVTFQADDDRLDGFGITTGLRYAVMENLEIGTEYQFRDYDSDDETVINAHVAYNYGSWVLKAQYETYDKLDIDEWSLGVGYLFGGGDSGSSSIW